MQHQQPSVHVQQNNQVNFGTYPSPDDKPPIIVKKGVVVSVYGNKGIPQYAGSTHPGCKKRKF